MVVGSDFVKQFENLKPGNRLPGKLKGACQGGIDDKLILLNGVWMAP